MPPRDVRMYLSDILGSARHIQSVTEGKSLENYLSDLNLRLIIERSFEIIGEALRQAIDVEPSLEESIGNARRIIGLRNILIHGYHMIDHSIVWDIVVSYLPGLVVDIERELESRA